LSHSIHQFGIIISIIGPNMEKVTRIFKPGQKSFFLLGLA